MGDQERRHLISSALTKFYGTTVDAVGEDVDVKKLFVTNSKLPRQYHEQVLKWINFAENFPAHPQSCSDAIHQLNDELAPKSVLLDNGFTLSEADVVVFAVLHSSVIALSSSEKGKLPHVFRWMDHIQNAVDFSSLFETSQLEKSQFNPPLPAAKVVAKTEDSDAKNTAPTIKASEKLEPDPNTKKSDVEPKKKAAGTKEPVEDKKKPASTEAPDKDSELSVSLLNIQVGLIRKAWKHPSADSLLVEEIDIGEAKLRQVVSGLAKYCSPEELMNRKIVLISNVKPGKLRDVMSEGLVLCASNEDHTVVEPLLPPAGAKIGERVSFSGIDGKPEVVLNPKKKQLEKITPNLYTDEKGVATFKGIPFMTTSGPCTSSIPKASIK